MSDELVKRLKALLGDDCVMSDQADMLTYSYDAAVLEPVMPAVAVRPTRTGQLGPIVETCDKYKAPITIRGSGTNLSGGTIPALGGVVLLTGALNRIIEINPADMYAIVEPGVVTAHFAAEAAKHGLFYPPDPGQPGRVHPGRQCGRERRGAAGPEIRRDPRLRYGSGVLRQPGRPGQKRLAHGQMRNRLQLGRAFRGQRGHLGRGQWNNPEARAAAPGQPGHDGHIRQRRCGGANRGRDHRCPHRARHPGVDGQLHHQGCGRLCQGRSAC